MKSFIWSVIFKSILIFSLIISTTFMGLILYDNYDINSKIESDIKKSFYVNLPNIRQMIMIGNYINLKNTLDSWAINQSMTGYMFDNNEQLIWESPVKSNDNNIYLKFEIKFENYPKIADLYLFRKNEVDLTFIKNRYEKLFLIFILSFALFISVFTLFIYRSLLPIKKLSEKIIYETEQSGIAQKSCQQNELDNIEDRFVLLKSAWLSEREKAQELVKHKAMVEIASQVSHDIRSPLSALNMTIANLKDIPEQQRITLRAASNRINDIANTLLTRAKEQKSDSSNSSSNADMNTNAPMKLQVELLPAILDTIVSEKRVQYRDKIQVEIEADFKNAYGAFADVNPMELSRVISNLINNSVEALPDGKGKFTLSVVKESNQVVIVAQDNGKGIPAHILEKLGQMGVTHGKEGTQSGSGLGVYHAKTTIEQFGGKFEIQSTPNMGTKIIMTLPLVPAPKWFVEKIKIAPQNQVISLDDDLSIHNVWKGRFQSLGFNQNEIQHLTFTSGIDFKDWVNNQPVSQSKNIQQRIYLVDYELLNQKQTGLDIVEELGIGSQSILVTSRYEEINIRERCEKLGVQLIPKGMAGLVPIELKQPLKHLDAILIDDDPLMGYVWTETAKSSHKSFEWFNDPELFFAKAEQYAPNVEIYIDVSLAQNVKGQDVAIKLSQLGFANLHLATGYETDTINKCDDWST